MMTESTPQPNLPTPDELRFLEPARVRLRLVEHRLEACLEEATWQETDLARLFPLSEPENWIAVLNADGKELGVLRTLHGLEPASLAAAREALRHRYLLPHIQAIASIRERADITEWTVETDRGPAVFQMRRISENLKQPLPGYVTLTDVEGNRYDVPDLSRLDPDSQRRLSELM